MVIDGVRLDPITLCATNSDGEPLMANKMGVKELRAELAARQCPLRGNKKELARQLQKARTEAVVDQALIGDSGKSASKVNKVKLLTVDQVWKGGKLVDRNEYQQEAEVPDDDDDDYEEDVSMHASCNFSLALV